MFLFIRYPHRLERAKPHLSSPYGLLRSPWNYNPSPYLARYGNVFGISNSSIIGDRDIVFKYHMGVTCDAFQSFFSTIKGQPLEDYLFQMEDDTHGIFHFTFGGVGGTKAKEAVQNLRDNYGFSYSNVAALAISAQPFFKKYLATNNHAPVNCTSKPWQNDALVTTIGPGEVGGPSCDFADFYYANEDELDGLISFFFDIDPDHFDETVLHMATLDFAQKTAVMKIIGNMFPMDGDLAGSGAGEIK